MLRKIIFLLLCPLLTFSAFAGDISPELKKCVLKVIKATTNMTEKEIDSKKIGQGDGWDKKEFRRILNRSEGSNHNNKHSRAKTEDEARRLSSGADGHAQYMPGLDHMKMERDAMLNRDGFYRSLSSEENSSSKNSTFYKYVKFESPVGFEGGKETNWMRVEWSSGTIHGQPISPARLKQQCPECVP